MTSHATAFFSGQCDGEIKESIGSWNCRLTMLDPIAVLFQQSLALVPDAVEVPYVECGQGLVLFQCCCLVRCSLHSDETRTLSQ